jgi:hypothetical protein
MFQRLYFHRSSGVLSIHRKRDLPAEESRQRAIKRIGNETQENPQAFRMFVGGNEEALTTSEITEE